MSLLRRYIRRLLHEDYEKRQAFSQDVAGSNDYLHGFSDDPKQIMRNGREIKKAFHANADQSFLSSLTTIHWAPEPQRIIALLKASKKDELSTNAYLPSELATGDYGDYGLHVKGHISLLANNMDDIVTGRQAVYRNQFGGHREKSSGINKGVAQAMYPPAYAEEDWAPIVLSKEDWNPVGSEVGIYRNEALVDNWKPVALVVSNDVEVPNIFKTFEEHTGIEIIRAGRGDE